jgi:hypothetical protein
MVAGEYGRLVTIAPLGTIPAAGGGNEIAIRLAGKVRLTQWFAVSLEARYARLWFSLDRIDAASVLDQYLGGAMGPEFSF